MGLNLLREIQRIHSDFGNESRANFSMLSAKQWKDRTLAKAVKKEAIRAKCPGESLLSLLSITISGGFILPLDMLLRKQS